MNWTCIKPSRSPPFLRAILLAWTLDGWHSSSRTGDAESCSSGSPRELQCFRAVFCPPPALCVPFCVCCSPEGQLCSGHSGGTFWSLSALGSGIRVLLVRKHSCWGLSWETHRKKKTVSPHQLSPFPAPAPLMLLGASCCKGASCWRGLFCGAGLGRDDGLSQAASAKINFSCLTQRVSGSAGVYLCGSGFCGRL